MTEETAMLAGMDELQSVDVRWVFFAFKTLLTRLNTVAIA
jgi:hypothetical protein